MFSTTIAPIFERRVRHFTGSWMRPKDVNHWKACDPRKGAGVAHGIGVSRFLFDQVLGAKICHHRATSKADGKGDHQDRMADIDQAVVRSGRRHICYEVVFDVLSGKEFGESLAPVHRRNGQACCRLNRRSGEFSDIRISGLGSISKVVRRVTKIARGSCWRSSQPWRMEPLPCGFCPSRGRHPLIQEMRSRFHPRRNVVSDWTTSDPGLF
ncbi:hypothetical protein QO002_004311 [Pararhizobium capsulatum DSM 1112]|uniref:Transposase n=1 Tax=Pararhizobium capsulatum DSM 1112 TaxID=1121113 RepID=A0ABU0BV25_9HYPH|nr:hypothetical protein [Pararhizobium capsulatum DSM 1112]